jgi:hypothetical protein
MMDEYNNLTLFPGLKAKRDAKKMEAQADLVKAQALADLAGQPAQGTNPLLIIIPVAVLLIGGVTAFILLRKKK